MPREPLGPLKKPLKWLVRNLGATAVAEKLGVDKDLVFQWMLKEVPVPKTIHDECLSMVKPLQARIESRALGHEDTEDLADPPDITDYIWRGGDVFTEHPENNRR